MEPSPNSIRSRSLEGVYDLQALSGKYVSGVVRERYHVSSATHGGTYCCKEHNVVTNDNVSFPLIVQFEHQRHLLGPQSFDTDRGEARCRSQTHEKDANTQQGEGFSGKSICHGGQRRIEQTTRNETKRTCNKPQRWTSTNVNRGV